MAGKKKWHKRIPASPSSFLRQRGDKPPAKGILIATEGVVTEAVYFAEVRNRLALPTVELLVEGKGIGDPRRLAEAALTEQKKRRKAARDGALGYAQVADFDELWIVFDTDIPNVHGKLHDGIQFAEAKNIRCAHSTPCFEYWLLLHRDRTTALMPKCEDVVPRLAKALGAPYSKSVEASQHLIPPLVDHLKTAEANAIWVRKYHEDGGTDFPCNPSTEVDRLIAAIRDAASPANQNK